MRYLKFSLMLISLLAAAGCNNEQTCNTSADCMAGSTCAPQIHICVANPTADLFTGPDMSVPPPPPDLLPGPDLAMAPPDMAPAAHFTTGMTAGGTLGGALAGPSGVCYGGGTLYVADTGNHRVLVYKMVADKALPVGAIGQPNLMPNKTAAPASATTLNKPVGVWCDDTSLLVADSGNNRVLYYASNPTTNSAADGVVGQPDFTKADVNRAGNPDATGLNNPRSAFWDGARIYIADANNFRVVGYPAVTKDTLKKLSTASADVVLGQAVLTTRSKPTAGAPDVISYPVAVSVWNGRMAVVDEDFHRVLFYPVPGMFTPGTALSADAVIGQMSLQGAGNGFDAASLDTPVAISLANGEFFVAEQVNNRVGVFEVPVPLAGTLGVKAKSEVGQPGFSAPKVPALSGPGDLNKPGGLTLANANGINWLVVADTGNNRVQLFHGQ